MRFAKIHLDAANSRALSKARASLPPFAKICTRILKRIHILKMISIFKMIFFSKGAEIPKQLRLQGAEIAKNPENKLYGRECQGTSTKEVWTRMAMNQYQIVWLRLPNGSTAIAKGQILGAKIANTPGQPETNIAEGTVCLVKVTSRDRWTNIA